jgi:sporulation protein YlmC with PRC-barrel domain
MEKFFSEILGTPIVSEAENAAIGRVWNMVLHPDNGQVVALSLNFEPKEIIVPLDIRGWYNEIIVSSSDVIIDRHEVLRVQQVLDMGRFFLGARVETSSGVSLGRVLDYAIDIEQLLLTKILVGKSFLGLFRYQQRLFSFQDIVEVKKDVIIVRTHIEGKRVAAPQLAACDD